jgi:MFS family permease
MQAVAVGWQVYAMTGSALALGFVGLAQFLPMLLLTFTVGHIVDRYDRRLVLRLCQLVQAIGCLGLAVGTFGGWLSVGGIYALVAAMGAARAFENPSGSALMPGLIPPALFPRAAALSTSAVQTATILGPAAGGFLYAASPGVPYAVATVLLLTASVFAGLIRMEWTPPRREPASLRSVLGGVAFIRSRPAILGSISLDLFAVLLGGATALLPIYARDILAIGPLGLGVLRCAPAIGALAMSVTLAHRPLRGRVGYSMFAAVVVFGIATIVFGLSRVMWLSLVSLAVLGAADVISMVVRQSLVQMRTPDAMRGRVSAVNSAFVGTSNQLGEFESGVLASLVGPVAAVVLGGVGTVAVALLWMRLFPELRDVDQLVAEDALVEQAAT